VHIFKFVVSGKEKTLAIKLSIELSIRVTFTVEFSFLTTLQSKRVPQIG
jgi:hypothetical protein